MVLVFAQEDVERVCNYLDAKGIVWHRYTPLNIEKLQEEERRRCLIFESDYQLNFLDKNLTAGDQSDF